MLIQIYFNLRKFLLIKFTLLLLGIVPVMSQELAEPLFSTEYKPGFYTSFALLGYQARSFSVDFSKIKYRTSGTGMMLSYISRYGGLNLNFFRALTYSDLILSPETPVLVNWLEAGINFPLLRQWNGPGFFSKFSIILTANTSLFERLYVKNKVRNNSKEKKYLQDSFPQVYDFGLEFRRNLISFKLGYLMQLTEYSMGRSEFAIFPADVTGPYFEIALSLGFWSKHLETRTYKAKKQILPDLPPDVQTSMTFIEPSKNGKLDGGESGAIQIELKNKGKGSTKGLEIRLRLLQQKMDKLTFSSAIKVNDLAPESSTTQEFPITAHQDIEDGQVEFEVEVVGKNFDPITKEISFDVLAYDAIDEPRRTNRSNEEAVAIVIGIRDYQKPGIPSVAYAAHDAEVMREYLIKTLGYRSENILPTDPKELMTAGNFKTLIRAKLKSFIHKGVSDVFFYYAGHGAPSTKTKDTFLVPYDCDPDYVTPDNAYKMDELYADLIDLEARHVTVVIDACFSGYSGDGAVIMKNISPVMIKVTDNLLPAPNMTIFTSSQADQVSNWYPEKRHGLFTYFFLSGLRGKADLNGDHRITAGEMRDYLHDERTGIPYFSNRKFQRLQKPVVRMSDGGSVLVDYER